MKNLDLQDKDLAVKLIREAIDKGGECWQFETALQHTCRSKLRVYRELKGEIEEYLKYVKGAPSRLFF